MAQGLAHKRPLTDRAAAPLTLLKRCTKPFLWLSLAGALCAATWGVSITFPTLRFIVPAVFLVAWAAARSRPVLVRQSLLGAFYLVPALFMFSVVFVPAGCWVVWMAPLCGAILATTPPRRWALPVGTETSARLLVADRGDHLADHRPARSRLSLEQG